VPEPLKPSEPAPEAEAIWRGILLGTDPRYRDSYSILKRLPGSPRCYWCGAPFAGPGAIVARRMGRKRWAKNPNYCGMCFNLLEDQRGGAEIECSLLFADVRGSTSLAEQMSATNFRALMHRFYTTAEPILFEHDAILDKFVGDEVVAIFVPALTGERHAARAVETGRALLSATGHGGTDAPWLPLGAGVHSGVAYVGAVGEPPSTTLTALGDVVNIAARLASRAGAGELLVSDSAATAAGLPTADLAHRDLALKGKSEQVPVFVLGADVAAVS
jgi:adenylate cyclase